MNEKTEVAPAAARALAVPPALPSSVQVDRMPRSVQWVLGRVPQQDWRYVETLLCRLGFTRDMVNAVQFTDTVFGLARNAECRTVDRITGTEMDGFREEIDAAVKKIVSSTVRLAKRAGLTEVLQRYRRLLRRFGTDGTTAEAALAKVA